MGLYLGGLIIGRIFVSEIWGAYFRKSLFFFGGGGGLLSEFYEYVRDFFIKSGFANGISKRIGLYLETCFLKRSYSGAGSWP